MKCYVWLKYNYIVLLLWLVGFGFFPKEMLEIFNLEEDCLDAFICREEE